MAQRVTLRKRQPYNTKSNRRRVVKTPGGKLVVHHLKKLAVRLDFFAPLIMAEVERLGKVDGEGLEGTEDGGRGRK